MSHMSQRENIVHQVINAIYLDSPSHTGNFIVKGHVLGAESSSKKSVWSMKRWLASGKTRERDNPRRKTFTSSLEAKRFLRCLLRSNDCLSLVVLPSEFHSDKFKLSLRCDVCYDKLDFVVKNISQHSSLMSIA
jgi:hypothetical protein